MTSSRGIAGAEQLLVALVAGGQERGWTQVVLNPFGDDRSAALAERCAPTSFETRECSSVPELPRLRSWLNRRLADLRPDIVHVMLFQATVLTASVPRRNECRLVTHVYGEAFAQHSHPRVRGWLDRWAVGRFHHVSAISGSVEEFLSRTFPASPPSVERIQLGWSGAPHPPAPSAARAPTVVCVAALRPEKGHDTLLTAFAAVREKIPDARLVLVGEGPQRRPIEAMIRSARMEGSVELAGSVTEIWPYLADADVFALASPTEALGIAIMEAMGAGLPVVATDVGGIPEVVTPGVTGELFAMGDHRDLAEKLIDLLSSPERRAAMSAAALRAAETMRMEHTVEEYFELYDRLLSGATGPHG